MLAAALPAIAQVPYTTEEVAASGTPAPAATYQAFYPPSINQGGTVAFIAIIGDDGFGSTRAVVRQWAVQGNNTAIYYVEDGEADPECVQTFPISQRSWGCLGWGIGDTVYFDNSDYAAFEGQDPNNDSPTDIVRGVGPITTPMIQETVSGQTEFVFGFGGGSDALRRGDYNNFGQVVAWMDEFSNGQPTGCASLLFSNGDFLPQAEIGVPTTAVPPGQQVLDTCNPPPVAGRSEPWVAGSFTAQRRAALAFAGSVILVNASGTLDDGPLDDPISGLFTIDPDAGGELRLAVFGDFMRDDSSMDINQDGRIVHESPTGSQLVVTGPDGAGSTTIVAAQTLGITSFNTVVINFEGQVAFSADTVNGQALYFWRPGTLLPQLIIEANGTAEYNGEIIENVWFGKDGFSDSGDIAAQIRTGDGAGTQLGDYILRFVQGPLPQAADIEIFDGIGLPNDRTVNFGDIEVGRPASATITISNAGADPLTIGQIAQLDPLDPPYSIPFDDCSQQVLEGGETCQFLIEFRPTSAGTAPADLFDIPSNDADEPSLSFLVFGNGVGGPTEPGELRFEQNAYSVGEGNGFVELSILRENGAAGAVTVDLTTTDGTATDGQDYTGFPSALTVDFADQETQRTVAIAILEDTMTEPDETFTATLSNATGGATIGAAPTTEVTITDDDVGADLEVEITSAELVVTQLSGGRVNLRVDYEVTVTNNGPDPVPDALVGFPTPPLRSMSYVSDDSGGTYNQNQIGQWFWAVGVLDAGQTETLNVVLEKIDPDASEAVTTGAEVLTGLPVNDTDTSNNTDSVTVVVGGVDMSVSIQDRADPVESNAANAIDDVIYDVALGYDSANNEAATNVAFAFDVPGQITDITPDLDECTRAADGRSFDCAWDTLDAGVDFVVTVSAAGGQTILATATVTADNLDPDPDNNSASEQTTLEDVIVATNPTGGLFPPSDSGNSCPLSGAALGTGWEPNLDILRKFRDRRLLTNRRGRTFVSFYYRHAPAVARWNSTRPWAQSLLLAVMTPVVYAIRYPAASACLLLGLAWLAAVLCRRRRCTALD